MITATPGPGPKPTSPAGPSPSGPAGPRPSPSGPAVLPSLGTGAPWPSRPQGPSGPAGPSGPGRAADDLLFAAVDQVLDDLKTPARRDLSPIGARTVATTGGPVSFSLPVSSGPPRFACDPYPPPFPGSPPAPPPPSPPRFEIGVAPQYDFLPRNWLLT